VGGGVDKRVYASSHLMRGRAAVILACAVSADAFLLPCPAMLSRAAALRPLRMTQPPPEIGEAAQAAILKCLSTFKLSN
jgi:hypothetical protein